MKTSKIVEIYGILNTAKLSGMETKSKMIILENLRILKPIAEGYKSDMETAQEKLKPEDFESITEKANRHNEAVKEKKEEGRMTAEELKEVNEIYLSLNKELATISNDLESVEHEVTLKTISPDEFGKLTIADEDAGKLLTLYEVLCEI